MDEKMPELKPCPFCGTMVEIQVEGVSEKYYYATARVFIQCPKCHIKKEYRFCGTGLGEEEATALVVDKWNTRKLTPTLEHAEELKKLVKSQRLMMNRLKSYLMYYSDMKISDYRDSSWEIPSEIKLMKRVRKSSLKVKNLLATIKAEEEAGK